MFSPMSMIELLPNMRPFSRHLPFKKGEPAIVAPAPQREPRSVLPLRPRIDIPVRDPSPAHEAAKRFRERGRFLARQDAWDDLAVEICEADQEGRLTLGLQPIASLLAEGARADALDAGRMAVKRGELNNTRAIATALEANLDDAPDCPALSCVVALTHVDLARMWIGASKVSELAPVRRDAYTAHMQTASMMADQFDPFENSSALWATVRCRVLAADDNPIQRVADDYEDLIELQPNCPDHMRALGRDLLPRHFGAREMLDREARRTALRTKDVWGMGGYAWVYMGAMEHDPDAARGLETDFFVEALHDIIERHPGQEMINRLAAFTGLSVSSKAEKGTIQARLSDCFNWIAQDHLHELHPATWALAPTSNHSEEDVAPDDDLLKQGRNRAMSALAEHFAPLLNSGRRLIFTPNGLQMPRVE